MTLPSILYTISKKLYESDARAILVGGSIRDHFLQLPIKDYDIEVYGLASLENLETILQEDGKVKLVGKSFGVLKFVYKGFEYDFSFPRKERKIAKGHRGFDISIDGSMTFKEAALRRDFTINAMGYDIQEKKFLDPYGGREALNNKVLRHINDKTFIEDPLRVYRGVQFCARFDFEMSVETIALCQNMVSQSLLEELPKERIYEEFKKLLLKSKQPSIGFELMRKLGALYYFPQLEALIGLPQDPNWHLEGDVWIHTLMSLDAMAQMCTGDEKRDLILLYAVVCLNLGKVTTTKMIDGKIYAIEDEQEGVELSRQLLSILTDEVKLIEAVLPLVRYHLVPSQFYIQNSSSTEIRRLSVKVNIENLVLVAKADFLGKFTSGAKEGKYEAGRWLLDMANRLDVSTKAPDCLLLGRDLLGLGLSPSPKFKEILDKVYALQLDGEISTKDEAIVFVKKGYL